MESATAIKSQLGSKLQIARVSDLQRTAGFTLTELLVAMTVFAILLGVAAPSMSSLVESNALKSQLSDTVGDLKFARAEALSRSQQIVICPTQDQQNCSNQNNWNQGWLVFSDYDRDGSFVSGSGTCAIDEDCLLRVADPVQARFSVQADSEILRISNLGEWLSGASTFLICQRSAPANTASRTITIMPSGSITTLETTTPCS